MQVTVFYEGWQMDCCGIPFSIGDVVTWDCDRYVNENRMIKSADYIYEAHCVAKYEITGIVIEIQAITYDYQTNGENRQAIGYSSKPIPKVEDFSADDYLVVLDQVQVKN